MDALEDRSTVHKLLHCSELQKDVVILSPTDLDEHRPEAKEFFV